MNRNVLFAGSLLGWFVACSGSTRLGQGESEDNTRAEGGAGGGEAGSGNPGVPGEGTGGSAGSPPEPGPPEGGTDAAAGASAGAGAGAGAETPGTPTMTSDLPCDVLEAAGHVCVAAHSTVRVLVS